MQYFNLNKKLEADTHHISDLTLCRLLIMNNADYPWVILVPRRSNISEIYQLTEIDRKKLDFEVNEISKKLSDYFKADKINIASIGNIVSQLHIHIVVRNKKDLSWPETVWGKSNNRPYSDNQLIKLKKEFQGMFAYL
ncbi:MAG: HIT domain-containing protein [Alphaproteobacteria bacterium]|jgi:diadenosine tetraphosphate (Ap4A) HIT family hydrolase|tara:strand:+ start:658 stop:1071 length:414 start_codon:yes stop_codon:yes gene_type:complete